MDERGYRGKTKDEVIELLQQFDWNWHLAADYLDGDADELKVQFAADAMRHVRRTQAPETATPFESAYIRPEHVARLQQFVRENLVDSYPVLFNDRMAPEQREEITSAILLDLGFAYKLTHAPEFCDAYKVLEDEAFQLAKWREQLSYLTVVEEALFRVSVRLDRERDGRPPEVAPERDS
jgi:hypothetical protein